VARTLDAAGVRVDLDESLARFLAIYSRRLLNYTRPYDGVPEAIAALAGRARLAVVTNKPEGMSRQMLEAFGLAPRFGWILGGDTPFGRKPDPAGLLHVIQEAGATPATTLFVGDSDVDVETARRAGARVCIAAYGFGQARGGIERRGDEFVAAHSTDLAAVGGRFLDGLAGERAAGPAPVGEPSI
jgi:phosphoglycolate phosphatase